MKKILLAVGLMLSTTSFAVIPNISIDGTIPTQITIHTSPVSQEKNTQEKNISLLHVSLSPQAKSHLAAAASKQLKHPFQYKSSDKMQLGMNNVPVFDQGGHGTCVTFAMTAAIDAAYGKSDYISQLCNLELGSYLHEKDASYPSGWDGSYLETVISQIQQYGIITMYSQVFEGCSGKHIYPVDAYTSIPLSDIDFKKRSVDILAHISTHYVLSVDEAFTSRSNAETLLLNLKKAVKAGNRVVIATLLDSHIGNAGIQGQYGIFRDSWILTPEIQRDINHGLIDSAHALVVTGFDDGAVIYGPNNTKHQGVLTIRNSWGLMAGDMGTYYMSYDYFKVMVFEALAIKSNI